MTIKEVIVENIHGEKFVLNVFLNLASIRAIEKELKQMDKSYNFYKCLPMIDKGELSITLAYICNCVHLEGKKAPLGSDFFDDHDINFLNYSAELISALAQCLTDNKSGVESKGK